MSTEITSLSQSSPAMRKGVADPFELQRRLSYCTNDDTTRGMFFNGALAAVLQAGTSTAVDACIKAAGIKSYIDFFNYPVSAFLKMAWKATEFMGAGYGSSEAVFRRLGSTAVDEFLSSAVGRTLLTVAGKNPRQLVANVPSAYKAAVSYGDRAVSWLGDKSARITFRRDLMHPAYHEGVLGAAIAAMGGEQVRVIYRQVGLLDTDFDVSWK